MMCSITVDGVERNLIIPESWEEVNFETFCKIISKNSLDEVLAEMYGLTKKQLKNINDESVYTLLSSPMFFVLTTVNELLRDDLKEVSIGGEVVKIPDTFQDIEFGLYLDLKTFIIPSVASQLKDVSEIEQYKHYPDLLKLIVQYLITGDYDVSTCDKYKELINKMNCVDVISLYVFFFKSWNLLRFGITQTADQRPSLIQRFKQGLRSLKKRLGWK